MTANPTPAAPAPGEAEPARRLFRIAGRDRAAFLQGLVTNDIRRIAHGPVYAALLTPQGKYLADFILAPDPAGDAILLDIHESVAEATVRRLALYRLRADVTIAPAADLHLHRGIGPAPADGWPDPRHPALGWRAYRATPAGAPTTDWTAIRLAHTIPETGLDLTPDTYILEAGFERLNGVDFRKGCYVGQEVTARMKHKTELRKGLVPVTLTGTAPPGTPILTADGREAGILHTNAGGRGIAFLRFDRATGPLTAGTATVTMLPGQAGL
jgi:folate-binding protein YgfZ